MPEFPLLRGVLLKGQFFAKSTDTAATLAPGTVIELKPEPTNAHDPYAVGAYLPGAPARLGYLQKEVSPCISISMQAGTLVICRVVSVATDKQKNVTVDIFMSVP